VVKTDEAATADAKIRIIQMLRHCTREAMVIPWRMAGYQGSPDALWRVAVE
jgi:hypothetical protein